MTDAETGVYDEFLRRRVSSEPVQYILNRCQFMGLDLYVDRNVLIPRPDTEILAEAVINRVKSRSGVVRALEIGTGSGCLSIALAVYAENASVTAADICEKALAVAQQNVLRYNMGDKVTLIQSDLFTNIPKGPYDIIFANPPYINSDSIETLQPSVKDFEPKLALDGGADGLFFYRDIISKSKDYLAPNGGLFLEIGSGQGEEVQSIMTRHGYVNIDILKDLSSLDRVAVCFVGSATRRRT